MVGPSENHHHRTPRQTPSRVRRVVLSGDQAIQLHAIPTWRTRHRRPTRFLKASGGMQALTIAVCTLNRPADLERCVRSVVAAECPDDLAEVEVLVIDDGHLPEPEVRKLERLVSEAGRVFSYLRNTARHGLIHGRMAAIRNATSDVLLFLA